MCCAQNLVHSVSRSYSDIHSYFKFLDPQEFEKNALKTEFLENILPQPQGVGPAFAVTEVPGWWV